MSTSAEIDRWWQSWPEANIAGVTGDVSGRAVVDVDGEDGLRALAEVGIELPETVMVETGRDGGVHAHFRKLHGAPVLTKAGVLPKVDIRADRGIVLLPGSDHVSGRAYRYSEEHTPGNLIEADLPEAIVALATGPKRKPKAGERERIRVDGPGTALDGSQLNYCKAALKDECTRVRTASEGIRNSTLNAAAFAMGQLVGAGFCEETARKWLVEAGLACGLTSDEVERVVERSMREGMAEPRDLSGIKADKPTTAQRVVELARRYDYFHDEMDRGYALVEKDGRVRCMRIRSRSFGKMLSHDYYKADGKVLNANSHRDAIGLLEARAVFEGERRKVFTRVARVGGAIYIDLGDDEYRVVEVTSSGWKVLSSAPVTFVRADSMKALPVPRVGATLNDLRPLVNVASDDQWVLFVGWLLGALRPEGPYPILIIQGEHGSAKSTLARFARALVDPDVAEVCRPPKSDHDLMIAAEHGHLLVFDNLSGLAGDLADTLCSLATGVGLRKRGLYTDDEEMVFQASRPIVLNGIESLTMREDIASRAVVLHLPFIGDCSRRTEGDVVGDFERLRPALFGALLDAVACALSHENEADPAELPRMADFAKWVTGAEQALGWEAGTFIKVFRGNYEDSVMDALDSDPVASFLIRAIAEHGQFDGSTQDLLGYMNRSVTLDTSQLTDWPKNFNQLSARLKRMEPLLRRAGIEIDRSGRTGKSRILSIRRIRSTPNWGASSMDGKDASLPVAFPRIVQTPPRNAAC